MADLPMAQIPNFSLGATPNPNPQAMAIQGAQGGSQALFQGIQAQQAQQALNMQKQQQTISQVDTLLKSGMNYQMLPTFWPAIATRMNSLSPDYQLDPNNPPENIKNFATELSGISDGVTDKVITLPQAHTATLQLIKRSYPLPVPPDVGQTAGTAGPTGQPTMQAPPQGQPQQSPAQGQAPQGGQPPASNPLTDFVAIKAQYDKANQLISQAPMEGPQSQEALRKQLEASSLGLNYKKALDQLATTANAQYSAGQENNRNQMNQNNEMARAAVGNFQEQSKEFTNVASNFSAFNHLMQLSSQAENQTDTTATVNAEKTALLNFAQMAYPGTGRPGNQEMLENMEKSGPYGTLISQYLNRLDKGDIMTPKQIKGLRQTALTLYQGRETEQSQLEKTYSGNLAQYGANPQQMLPNIRPQSVISTSTLHPSQSSDNDPLIGHVRQFASGKKMYLGGPKANNDNWADVGDSGQ